MSPTADGKDVPDSEPLIPAPDDVDDSELLALFWALHAAVLKRDGLEKRVRTGEVDQELLDRSIAAAEAVVAARAALYRHLVATGWKPPEILVQDRSYDDAAQLAKALRTRL